MIFWIKETFIRISPFIFPQGRGMIGGKVFIFRFG